MTRFTTALWLSLWLALLAPAQTVVNGSRTYLGTQDASGATALKIVRGAGAPSSGACDSSGEVGSVYQNTNVAGAFYVCQQTGSSVYEWVPITGGSTPSVTTYPDPAYRWYGKSDVVIDSNGSLQSIDPQVVWDAGNSQWVMYLSRTLSGSPFARCYYRTAPKLTGPWSSATEMTSLAGYLKAWLMVDETGLPVQVGGNYHWYAVSWDGTIANKEIYHFYASSLTSATPTAGSKVIAKGGSGARDEYNTDTPSAIYKSGTVDLIYMGAPASSLTTYGYAIRMLRATASDPDGSFTKDSSDVLLPSTNSNDFDYGLMGGVQRLLRPDGTYLMVYNACNSRPGSPGLEPDSSQVGYAYASSLAGPWTKDGGSPWMSAIGGTINGAAGNNFWRSMIAYQPYTASTGKWFLFYNAGANGASEVISYANEGTFQSFDRYANTGGDYTVQTITASEVAIANSRVYVPPGVYRVHAQVNLAQLDTGLPKIGVYLFIRKNGTAQTPAASSSFIGSYNFENLEVPVEDVIAFGEWGYIDFAVQCFTGTPTSESKVRRMKITVQRMADIRQ